MKRILSIVAFKFWAKVNWEGKSEGLFSIVAGHKKSNTRDIAEPGSYVLAAYT